MERHIMTKIERALLKEKVHIYQKDGKMIIFLGSRAI
jgi:hypothetical protein